MIFRVFEHEEELASFAADHLIETIRSNPNGLMCLATGSTPLLTYQLFVSRLREQRVDYSNFHFIGLDEWVGIPDSNPGGCHYFLQEHVLKPLVVKNKNYHLFNGLAADLRTECLTMDEQIRKWNGIDMMVVGIGMNGHIGFNEPHSNPDQHAYLADLTETTRQVGQKYFVEKTELSKGLTLGLKHFFESRQVLMLANGSHKADIIRRTISDPISMEIPATQIRRHQNAYLLLDTEAAAQLNDDHH